jgi:hypothetical protein
MKEGNEMGELIEYKRASLKASELTEDEEVDVAVAALPALEVGIRNHWEPDDELKSDKIEHCLQIVRWNLIDIGEKLGMSQADVARYALHYGIRRLYQLPGIVEIRTIRSFVLHNSDDPEHRGWFDSGSFDLGTNQVATLRTRLFENDIAQCAGLASILGLGPPLIRQLAMMSVLIESRDLPVENQNQMVGILKRFRDWIEGRVEKARWIKARVEEEAGKTPKKVGAKMTWEDVIG